jgi:hypothetical protein
MSSECVYEGILPTAGAVQMIFIQLVSISMMPHHHHKSITVRAFALTKSSQRSVISSSTTYGAHILSHLLQL